MHPAVRMRVKDFNGGTLQRVHVCMGQGRCAGPAAELEGSERDNVVAAVSGLVSVGGVDELWDVPNSDDTVRKENCGFCVNTGVDEPVDVG
jgi:hypothetical protein